MYIFIPLALIVISFIGIGVIVFRKLPYLRKLTPESHEFGSTVFHDFFPEFFAHIGKIHLEEYVAIFLREMEKLVRKIRLFFSRIDRASSDLIAELRSASRKNEKAQAPADTEPLVSEPEFPAVNSNIEIRPRKTEPNMVALKAEEQRYIIEIAHHPKNAILYATLGEIYVKMDNLRDAKESFEAAINLDPENEKLKERLSFISRKLHETKVGF